MQEQHETRTHDSNCWQRTVKIQHILLAGNTHLTVITAYAPAMMYADEEKEAFYHLLSNTQK